MGLQWAFRPKRCVIEIEVMSKNGRLRKRVIFAAKLLVTTLLCMYLLAKADWTVIWSALSRANPLLILVVFGAMVFCVTISAWKWQLLLSIHGISFHLGALHRYYLVALFFNNFLPSNIGGDIYRIYKTWKNKASKTGAVIAVLLERASGMWALLFLGCISGMFLLSRESVSFSQLKTITVVFTAGLILPFICSLTFLMLYFVPSIREKLPIKVLMVYDRLGDFKRHRTRLFYVMLVSFFFHIFSFAWMMLLFHTIGADFYVAELAVTVAISNLAAMLPLSINGIGLLDGSFTYLATEFGMTYEYALTFLLLMRGFTMVISLFGCVFYIKERESASLESLRMERGKSSKECIL
jgi:glycosyltransferase 2 family protein